MRVLEVFVIFSMVMVSLIQAYVESIKLCYTYMWLTISQLYFKVIVLKCIRTSPRLVWLSGFSASLWTEGLPVRFPSGHIPGLQARSLVGGVREATKRTSREADVSLAHWCFSPSLSPSLPFSLEINKQHIFLIIKCKRMSKIMNIVAKKQKSRKIHKFIIMIKEEK